jgi:VWFA-related protein
MESGGPVLELGPGTGRITIPIAEDGLSIYAVDSDEGMRKALQLKVDRLPEDVRKRIVIVGGDMRSFRDAVAAALEHLKKGDRDKQSLIVISDGADNASRHNLARMMALARQSEAIIYTIGIYDRDDPDRNPGSLKRLAKATGGEAFLPGSVKDVVPICERIARDIRNQYTITYVPKDIKYDGKYRVIQVKAGRRNMDA